MSGFALLTGKTKSALFIFFTHIRLFFSHSLLVSVFVVFLSTRGDSPLLRGSARWRIEPVHPPPRGRLVFVGPA